MNENMIFILTFSPLRMTNRRKCALKNGPFVRGVFVAELYIDYIRFDSTKQRRGVA